MTAIALLRGVNLAGRNACAMTDLRALFEGLGFRRVRTLLQSGNVVFELGRRAPTEIERLFERETSACLGLTTDFFVRTAREWKAAIAGNPFEQEARRDPGHLLLVALKEAPAAKRVEALRAAIPGREVLHVRGRHAYIVYPDGVGRSKLTTAMIDRILGTRGTARNWNTVLKLGALADDDDRN